MTKVVFIEACTDCPHRHASAAGWEHVCLLADMKSVTDHVFSRTLPEWCPLPDAQKREEDGRAP